MEKQRVPFLGKEALDKHVKLDLTAQTLEGTTIVNSVTQ
jgi:hypothetical protein